MDAISAVPILNRKVEELEEKEPSWKNCRACPFSGKCCDGAALKVFPEEKRSIAAYLRKNPGIVEYALRRFNRGEKCYFYDKGSSSCRIHDVRPLNCRWTPYTAFRSGKGGLHSVHVRDAACNFTTTDVVPMHTSGSTITISPVGMNQQVNRTYLSWQSISELHPLMRRADELEPLELLMAEIAI